MPYSGSLSLWLQHSLPYPATTYKSPAHSSTGTQSDDLVVLLLVVSLWFHVLFTPLPGFFSPFPHGTVSLSVIQEYLALRGGPRRFTRNSTCSMLLGIWLDYFNFQLQDYHFLWLSIPTYSSNCPNRFTIVPLPLIHRIKFRLLPFRSPLLRESFFTFFSSRY